MLGRSHRLLQLSCQGKNRRPRPMKVLSSVQDAGVRMANLVWGELYFRARRNPLVTRVGALRDCKKR